MKDLAIFNTDNGGDLVFKVNDIQMIDTYINQIYLALFGGQDEWYGNNILKQENQFVSNLKKAIDTTVLNSAGINNLLNAAKKDLEFLRNILDIEIKIRLLSQISFELLINVNSNEIKFVVKDGQLIDNYKNIITSSFSDDFSNDFK